MSATSSQVKDVPCYFEADAEPRQVSLMFFDDMPSVPYIRIDDFYQTFMHGKMDVVASDGGVFTLTVAFKADRNADGKVDAADDEVSFDLRFAVLVCGSSYSSAHLLPQLLHERGVAVLGEQSGGGPCGLEYCTTVDGWRFTISSNTQVKSDSWENIDGGVPVDAELVKAGEDGKRDYSGLYDLDAMSAAIASFYSK